MTADGRRGAEDGLGEMDDRPLTRREKIATAVVLAAAAILGFATGEINFIGA